MSGYDAGTHWQQLVLEPFDEFQEAEGRLVVEPDGFKAIRAGITAAFFLYHFHEVAWARGLFPGQSVIDVRQQIEQAARSHHKNGRAEDHGLLEEVVNAVKHGFLVRNRLLYHGDHRIILVSPGRIMVHDEEHRGGAPMVIVETNGAGDRSLSAMCQNVIYGWHDLLGFPAGT